MDEDSEYQDWIELYNHTSSSINLNGYHLSDDASFLKKWTFPSVSVKPWSYLLVFASDKNRNQTPVNYKTIIPRGDEWEYIVPSSEPANSWKYPGFVSSAWKKGKSGFGFGDNDDSTVFNVSTSVFIRKEFNMANVSEISDMVLSIDYDDGFIAYINGYEIARSNVGTAPTVPFNQVTGTLSREATMYSGGSPVSFTIPNPQAILKEGTNVIAVQGHNSSATSSDLTLIPMLTFGFNSTEMVDSVPVYIRIKGRKLHTNFKISNEGETIILSRPDSSVADSVSPVHLTNNISFGRKPDGESAWLYFGAPSPCGPNSGKGFGSLNTDTVVFSVKGGYQPAVVELQLSSKYNSDSIFYTLDGSDPSRFSSRYTGPISVTGSKVVRAVSLKSDRLPGEIATNTYITKKHSLPVVCVSTNPANLWDYYTGIYVLGPNASTVSPYKGANFWQDWEKKAHIELYDTNGIKQIDQGAGIKIYGAYSRARPQKSLALYARKEYGKGSFEYKVFKDKPIEVFESLVLRNSGNDWGNAIMRDGLTSTLIRDMDMDRQAFQPAVIYLNGEYWGIQDIREKINEDFLAENHFVDPENVNLLVSNATVIEGTNTGYNQIVNFLNSNSLITDQNYKQVESKIDVNNYIQYQLTQIYIDNRDWPGNNIKFWNTNYQGSLWRWIIYDTDFGFGYKGATAYTYNTLEWALVPDAATGSNRPWATLLFRQMTSNKGFRDEFVNQYADRINRNFSPERVTYVIDSIIKVYQPEMGDHLARWNITNDKLQSQYAIVKNFALNRPENAISHLRTKFSLGEPMQIKVELNQPGTGTVKVNSIFPYKYPFYGKYFKDLPIKLTAVPAPGYKFVKWEIGSSVSHSPSIDYDMSAPGNFRAVFAAARLTDKKVVINEINYNSSPAKNTKDWVELYNAGNSTVNLKNWVISDGEAGNGYIIKEDHILSPGMYFVICRDLAAFRTFWTKVTNSTGNLEFGLSSSGDQINLYDQEGNLVDFVEYDIDKPWPVVADNSGEPIELTNAFSDNNEGKNWKSTVPGGTPGTINLKATELHNTSPQSTVCSLSSYPTPFRDYTTIMIDAPSAGRYRIDVYNTQGKLLNTLFDQSIETGKIFVDWYGDTFGGLPVPEGVYIIRLTGEKQHVSTRVIKLK
jgi:hypothetical protein